MNEFSNRISAQRNILKEVNERGWPQEDLHGLSAKALSRWESVNRLDVSAKLVKLLHVAASKLFFLANKSQEQISDEYHCISREVELITTDIRSEISLIKSMDNNSPIN